MAGGFHDMEAGVQSGQPYRISLRDCLMRERVSLLGGRVDGRCRKRCEQSLDAADMIVVMVCDQDGFEFQIACSQCLQDGQRIARIDNSCMTPVP